MKHLHVGMGLVALSSLLGCPNVEPCSSVEDGDTLELSLQGGVEEYIDYETLPSCGGFDDPPQVARLKMSNGEEHGSCVVAGCPTDFPSPSEPLFGGVTPGPGNQYVCESMGRKIRIDGCEARRDVVIRSLSGANDFFSPSSTIVLIRKLGYTIGGGCPDPRAPADPALPSDDPADAALPSPEEADGGKAYWCSDAWVVKLARK